MSDKNKKPELLEEGFFSSLFQLHFLQHMFGGNVEGWDPEQDKFLKAQEQLPSLRDLMDKYDNDQEKCAEDPKCRSELGKIMNKMPDELKDATRAAYQMDAAEQLGEAETSILALVEAIAKARNMTLDVEPFKSMDSAQQEKVLAIYDKIARPAMNQLNQIWVNLLTVIEKNKKDLPPEVAKEINLGGFESEIQKAMGAYQHLAEDGVPWDSMLNASEPTPPKSPYREQQDPYNVGSIGGPRLTIGAQEVGLSVPGGNAGQNSGEIGAIIPNEYGGLEEAEGDTEQAAPAEDPSKALENVFAVINQRMQDVTAEIKTLGGYMTGTDESPFGLDQAASAQYAERLMGLVNQIDDAFYKRLPNMIARATGIKDLKKSPREVGPNFDPSKMDQYEKMKKAEELVMLLKKYKKENNQDAMTAALKSINMLSEPLAKKVADKYGINISSLNERQKFYESFGDFS